MSVLVPLAIAQWLPWILAMWLPPVAAAIIGATGFAAVLAWCVRRTPPTRRRSWGLSPSAPAAALLIGGLAVGAAWSVTISTSVFIAFHAPKWQALVSGPYAVQLAIAGIAFALAYLRTGTLWLGTALHAGWNLGAYLLTEGAPRLTTLAEPIQSGWGEPASWLPALGNAVLLLVVLAVPRRRQEATSGRAGSAVQAFFEPS